MKRHKKWLCGTALALAAFAALLTGCTSDEPVQSPDTPPVVTEPQGSEKPAPETSDTTAPDEESTEASLYIGTSAGGFTEYPVRINGEVTAEALIAAISDLTDWDLTLADEVTSGKGGMSVSFAPECALFAGPPETQKEEFFAYDNFSLAQMILDSIQETLRRYYVMEPGDPESLSIWFSAGDEPIEIEGITIPMDQPWDSQFLTEQTEGQ